MRDYFELYSLEPEYQRNQFECLCINVYFRKKNRNKINFENVIPCGVKDVEVPSPKLIVRTMLLPYAVLTSHSTQSLSIVIELQFNVAFCTWSITIGAVNDISLDFK